MASDTREDISRILTEVTSTSGLIPESSGLRSLKSFARASESNLRNLFDLLGDKLRANHSQVRYLTLHIVDELFMRSKLFRELLVSTFESFLQYTVGHRTTSPLPPPSERALMLREKALEFTEKWNGAFGLHYRALHLGFRYLKDTLRYKFPNLLEQRVAEDRQRRMKEDRMRKLLAAKLDLFQENFSDLRGEIEATLDQMQQAFEILESSGCGSNPSAADKENNGFCEEEFSGDEYEETMFGARELRRAALETVAEEKRRKVSADNSAVLDSLRELLKVLCKRHIPATQGGLTLLFRVETNDKKQTEQLLKSLIDLKNRLLDARTSCAKYGVTPELLRSSPTGSDDEEDIEGVEWETGPIVIQNIDAKMDGRATEQVKNESIVRDASKRDEHGRSSLEKVACKNRERKPGMGSEAKISHRGTVKENPDLLQKAPVIPWGHYLEHWGEEHRVQIDSRGLDVDNHWGPVDSEAVFPADRVKEFSQRTSYYEPQALPNRPCKAPLKSGGLCQRRDFLKCPMHGVIIPRDEKGQPIAVGDEGCQDKLSGRHGAADGEGMDTYRCDEAREELNAERDGKKLERSQTKDSNLRNKLAHEAVNNVRKSDRLKQEQKRQEILKQTGARRAREHNDAVLRQAALAGTSQGHNEILGEDSLETVSISDISRKRKKTNGLAAMLHKPETIRDRLSKRLLNTRVNDAVVEHIDREEDRRRQSLMSNNW